jgi:hypothetical protein
MDHHHRSRRTAVPHVPSPLDPFLRDFLGWVVAHDGGLNPTQGLKAIAEEFDWQPAFAEVLFTAARSRGLVQSVPLRGSRGKVTWQISARGTNWLDVETKHAEQRTQPGATAST